MEYRAYSIRWIFAAVMWIGIFNHEFTTTSYTIVNNVVSAYFNISSSLTDVLGVIGMFSGAVALLIALLWLKNMKFRAQSISACVLAFVGTTGACLGFIHRTTYWMTFVGQVLIGISGGLFHAIPLTLAASWFPASESATVIGIAWNADSLGIGISSILFPSVLHNTTDNNAHCLSPGTIQVVFIGSFSMLCLLLFVASIIMLSHSKDNPPNPPSLAQQNFLQLQENIDVRSQNLKTNIKDAFEPFKNRDIILILIIRNLGCSIFAISVPLISSMMLGTFEDMDDSFPGVMRISGAIISAIGSVIIGRFLDKFGLKKQTVILCAVGMIISSLGIYFGHFYSLVYLLAISYPLANMFSTLVGVGCTELLLDIGYPIDPFILISWFHITTGVSVFCYSVIERSIMDTYKETAAAILPVVASCLALAAISVVRPDYRRSITEDQNS